MIGVFRLGHRLPRDERITTHVALTARALGASYMAYSGTHDPGMEESVQKVVERWGGDFKVFYVPRPMKYLKELTVPIVHLTMYGAPFQEKMEEIKGFKDMVVVVGGEKVPGEVYQISHNISIGNQPHSEVAALAIFLYELTGGKYLYAKRPGAKIEVIPSENKKLIKIDGEE
ncbi:MAG: tRNA (cytidine(56)-2'-O)-methyltransferase [Candidatus Micrarchaeota archaeon]|nr:tRNA (cytidine(56)-2'-O)-methyltransferase [Candidatus Micrarchaeota archaeon]